MDNTNFSSINIGSKMARIRLKYVIKKNQGFYALPADCTYQVKKVEPERFWSEILG